MKYFIIISSLFMLAVAQSPTLNCTYFLLGDKYACSLTIDNPNGLNNFTQIGGIHFEGYTNGDTELIYRDGGVSTNVPRIICETFPNVIRMEFYNMGLTEIGDGDFAGCLHLTELGLSSNKISSISSNAFVNLIYITNVNLNSNLLKTLPENLLVGQGNLTTLDLSLNPFENIPTDFFQPLENLDILHLSHANLNSINSQWFSSNKRLSYLHLANNRIAVSAESFIHLQELHTLNLGYNAINKILPEAFARLQNLKHLYLNGNNLTKLEKDSFPNLQNLELLEIGDNPITELNDGAFRGLRNLNVLSMSNCRLQQLTPNTFEDLRNLNFLSFNFNQLEQLTTSVFALLPNLFYLGLWNNRLKTLRRNSFGSLSNLNTLDLEGNVMNGLDRAFIDDAVNLNSLYFNGNLCANNYFANFLLNRAQYLLMLERCFSNIRYIVETVTEGDSDFSIFESPHPGIALRVKSNSEVQIALAPFNFIWNPLIEILIGTTNNTRSLIRINQENIVAIVPTPNIITQNQWNDFRVTWANQVILVYSGNNNFPFVTYTMEDFFPVNFYGLRSVEIQATWSIQPFGW